MSVSHCANPYFMKLSRPTILTVFFINIFIFIAVVSYILNYNNQNQNINLNGLSYSTEDPISLYIPKLNLRKPIYPGIYDFKNSTWNVSSNYPHFATVSVKPNITDGNTVLYAHNSSDLFGKINKLKNGDQVMLKTKNNKMFVYGYESSIDVPPSNVSIFKQVGKPYLVLLTCTGKNNSLRKLVYFKFIEVI